MSLMSGSSPSSGHAPPLRLRVDEDITRKDPKYKRYCTNIDRALALVDSSALHEWADYISFLGRLLKALQSHPALPLIPSKHLVAKRLAQCLNARLPSGVHQKTIEVYSYIFSRIGRDGLSNDLALWTPGLAPVLSYASLTLKPHYLELLETFYIPLGKALRPALLSLILALLPGIDEEGGEYFDRTLALIDGIRSGVGDEPYFWQCFLLATIKSSARRQGALAYLGKRLPALGRGPQPAKDAGDSAADAVGTGDEEAVISPEPGLLIRAFCAGLGDEQLLVQRGFLDLLVTHLPLSSKVLQEKVSKQDLQLLVISAASVVLRRDMSLNRRLWSWVLGGLEDKAARTYFESNGLEALIGGLEKMFKEDATPVVRARPYRICLSLMDRWDIGSLVVPRLFRPAINSLLAYEKTASDKEAYAEVLRSASMFFDAVEARLIWAQVLERISAAFTAGDVQEIHFVRFIIRTFNVKEEEMTSVHGPLIFLAVLQHLAKADESCVRSISSASFLLLSELWELVPRIVFHKKTASVTSGADETDASSEALGEENVLDAIQQFYQSQESNQVSNGNFFPEQLPINKVSFWILNGIGSSVQNALEGRGADDLSSSMRCRLLVQVIQKLPKLEWKRADSLVASFLKVLQSPSVPFVHLQGITNIAVAMNSKGYLSPQHTDLLIRPLVSGLWQYLAPDLPKYHVETVKALWNLQGALGDRRIESAVAMVMKSKCTTSSLRSTEHAKRFAVLWRHSVDSITDVTAHHMVLARPLFLFLDCLAEDETEITIFAQEWLQTLGSMDRLFSVFVTSLLGCLFLKDPGPRSSDGSPVKRPIFNGDDYLDIATYYFTTLTNVLKCIRSGNSAVAATLSNAMVIESDERRRKVLAERDYGDEDMTLQIFFIRTTLRALEGDAQDKETAHHVSKLHRSALDLLLRLLQSSPASPKPLADLELEDVLSARLLSILQDSDSDSYVQVHLLEVLYAALELSLMRPTSYLARLQQISRDNQQRNSSRLSLESEKIGPIQQVVVPQQLLQCLIAGLSSANSKMVLYSWVEFLAKCLPLIAEVMFQVLIPLVECLCAQIRSTFESLKAMFNHKGKYEPQFSGMSPESTLVVLLDGLEQVLATAHDKLARDELNVGGIKSPDTPASSGFFGNMVSGVFSVEGPQNRGNTANNRLTVLLCFKDTVKICYSIWSWSDVHTVGSELDTTSKESWVYTSLRLRGRARRILEHMFAAETLECLETLIELWPGVIEGDRSAGNMFRLVNVLDGSQPKHTIPTIFNAIYSRTNPSALDPAGRSSLTAELTDIDVVVFLVEYARSLEDDAMDEIWADCMTFLRDVLANPFPHRQILPMLLSFTSILGEKMEGTNFGDQKKMRKELGDLFLRTLTATLTVTPVGQRALEPPAPTAASEKEAGSRKNDTRTRGKTASDDVVTILVSIAPELPTVLQEPEKVTSASITISTNLIGPLFRSKTFPHNVSPSVLELLYRLTRLQNNQKAWKKELSEALLDQKFFLSPVSLVTQHWVPLAQQCILNDRERMTDLLARITQPTQSGFMLGVGATSARQEMDRKTQLNLKRIAFLIFAGEQDAFVVNLRELEEKMVELLSATPASSPSSSTRAEVFLVMRALALRTTSVHMSRFWPIVNAELYSALSTPFFSEPDSSSSSSSSSTSPPTYTDASIVQACKLLDALLVVAPDEFQLHEWLFVTDTIEAVYHPHDWSPAALVDQLAMEMTASSSYVQGAGAAAADPGSGSRRPPWFRGSRGRADGRAEAKADGVRDLRKHVVAPFLNNISISAYEGVYAMEKPDVESCERDLVEDLFEEGP